MWLQALALARQLGALCKPRRAFALSALRSGGTEDLREWLVSQAQPEEWEFPAGMPTDLTWPELAAELVREKLYWAHNHEVPYKLAPRCESMQELPDGTVEARVVRSARFTRDTHGVVHFERMCLMLGKRCVQAWSLHASSATALASTRYDAHPSRSTVVETALTAGSGLA